VVWVGQEILSVITINSTAPVILNRDRQVFMVRYLDLKVCSTRRIKTTVAIHAFKAIEVYF
jgi:flagellar assembly factor FliW